MKPVNNKAKALAAIISSFLMTCSTFAFAAQECNGTTVTTDESSFEISESEPGFVIHSSTGLAWARCVVGQQWNDDDGTCDGLAVRLTWQDALKLSNTYELEQRTDWRVPNIKELASIVERNCVTPAVNATIFPNTPSGEFWSSSPKMTGDSGRKVWAVLFSTGGLDSYNTDQDFYVRMVRYAEQH
ncbi:MAG: hypothetical protein ACJAZB_000452 [Psychrosphaera sp.]|jgi:hypothetical protein|uniref:Lcl C-terminal domain-containing protein n=1 Tax=uncultured Psychrosphaera sp. TaxID=1403522 RepID=UPI0030FBC859